jgi:hypothetical protein
MVHISGHIIFGLDINFAIVPELGRKAEWKEISEIKKNDACWINTQSNHPLSFGIVRAILVTSEPIIHDNYIEFDFVDFM